MPPTSRWRVSSSSAALENEQGQYSALSQQLEQAVAVRSYWMRLLTDLNSKFENDLVRLTVIEPLKNDKPITPQLVNQECTTDKKDDAEPGAETVYKVRLQGLYRKDDEGEQVVYRYATAIAKLPWFGIADFEANRAKYVSAQSGVEEDRYAYTFNITLPLSQPMKFKD